MFATSVFLASLLCAVALPGFTPLEQGPQGGTVLSGVLPGTERPGFVYLPPHYDEASRYPVVYLLHGMPGSPGEYLAGIRLAAYADDGIAAGRIRPFIAVAPAAGPSRDYNGEWAGPLETEVMQDVIPWVDTELSTIPDRRGRIIAGLSAGGFGAADIGLRNNRSFGTIISWSGYFHPLRDGPFRKAPAAELEANDPRALASEYRSYLFARHVRFFVSSGPAHSHWFGPQETVDFARELRGLGLPVTTFYYSQKQGEWQAQFDAGLDWALAS